MVRPTLVNGDIWSASLANASIRPQVGTDDNPGFFAPLPDFGLSNDPGNLKARFYSWYDRLRLTATGGLAVVYQGAIIRSTSGSLITLSPGTLFLPASQTGFISVVQSGNTAVLNNSPTLPMECLPVGVFVTGTSTITTLTDIRDQSVGAITVQSIPTQSSPWSPGDLKPTFRNTVEAGGWLFSEGQSLSKITYPLLFDAIGYTYGGSGNNFNVPDCRGRSLVCFGQGTGLTNRNFGYFGGEQFSISLSNLPSHNHAVIETPHIHGFNGNSHDHVITDYGHNHVTVDNGHNHRVFADAKGALIPGLDLEKSGAEISTRGAGAASFTVRSQSNVNVAPSSANVAVNPARISGDISANATGIQIAANGGSQPITIAPPAIVVRFMIKL